MPYQPITANFIYYAHYTVIVTDCITWLPVPSSEFPNTEFVCFFSSRTVEIYMETEKNH